MRILLLSQVLPYYSERGSSLRVDMMVRALTDMEHVVELVTTHLGSDIDLNNLRIHRIWKVPYVKRLSLGFSVSRVFLNFLLFWKAMSVMRQTRCDVIQGEDVEGAFWGVFLKLIFRKPLIYSMHNSFSCILRTYGLHHLVKLARLVEKFIYRSSDFVIANWDFAKEDVLEVVQIRNLVVIHDRVPTAMKRFSGHVKLESKMIVYTGNFMPYQGVDLLIKAFKTVARYRDDVTLILIGPNPPDHLLDMASGDDRIFFTHELSLQESNWLVSKAIVAVLPRTASDFPAMKLINYIQFGKAIVAVNIPANSLFLTDLESVVLCEQDPIDMAKKLLWVITNNEIRKSLERNVAEIANQRFSFTAVKKDLARVYNAL